MNFGKTLSSVVLGFGVLHASSASALLFDQNVTPDVIFGSGNANGSFTVDQNNGVELGLRGKLRHDSVTGAPQNIFNSNGDGTYSFNPGVPPTQTSPTAEWSFEWSINSDYNGRGGFLNTLNYVLGLDSDASAGTSFLTFDPINGVNTGCTVPAVYWDHALGTNATGNGGGTSASPACDATAYAAGIAANNVAQNSWKPSWFLTGFDPTVDGTYDFFLQANDASGNQVARTSMQIIVGQGGAPVPVPATVLLFGAGLLGIGVSRRKS